MLLKTLFPQKNEPCGFLVCLKKSVSYAHGIPECRESGYLCIEDYRPSGPIVCFDLNRFSEATVYHSKDEADRALIYHAAWRKDVIININNYHVIKVHQKWMTSSQRARLMNSSFVASLSRR